MEEDVKKPVDENSRDDDRVNQANEVCCKACEASGVRVSSWESFDAWNEFVEGTIGEHQLADKAKTEVSEFAESFRKYIMIKKKEDDNDAQ
jgi:hypothetical protein